jgi:FkbM family methyltransferase
MAILAALATRRPPAFIRVRTPTGLTTITLRNFESLKTAFSVFCRRDYDTSPDQLSFFLDVGANVGIAAAYFLSRNTGNRIRSFEPDQANLPFLRHNLASFGDRAEIIDAAVGVKAGIATLFRSDDGKYSSLMDQGQTSGEQATEVRAFSDILDQTAGEVWPIVVKIDIEGLEVDLVKSVDFSDYPTVARIIVESTECSALVFRPHLRVVRADYVEDLSFT